MSAISQSSGNAIVDSIVASWATAFNRLDANALASPYSDSALFYGSVPTLFRVRAGISAYFNA